MPLLQHLQHRRRNAHARRLRVESLEQRCLLATLPFGANTEDTGEFMLGRVLVTPVFMESNGGIDADSETWTPQQIADTKAKIVEAMTWWEDTLAAQGTVHSLEFEFDFTFADNPVSTPYEPISRHSNDFDLWIDDFFDLTGHNQSASFSVNSRSFNHAQREAFDTDWAFTIFVVNDANDADGFFAEGGSFFAAFAFAGGRFYVSPAGRPASTFAHEVGHMFWARDEHDTGGSHTDRRGYYNTPNLNAADNPAPGFQQVDSIMAAGTLLANAFANHTSSPSSLEMIGWRDSDHNGVFDVLDVPHRLTGSGAYLESSGVYHFAGSASVATLPNRNSSGLQNDITINRISEAQFRIDGGAWQTAEQYGGFTAELDLRIPVPGGFSTIEIRTVTIDPGTGQIVTTSPLFTGDSGEPDTTAEPGISGFVWYDVDGDGVQTGDSEPGIAGATVALVNAQGQPLPLQTTVEPDNFNHRESIVAAGATFSVVGEQGAVAAINNVAASTGGRVFGAFRQSINLQRNTWTGFRHMRINFNQPVTFVQIDAIGGESSSFGRLEVYDSSDNLLARYTTGELSSNEIEVMHISHPTADIAYAIVKGHDDTEILLDNLRIGPPATVTTDARGGFYLGPLPAGSYTVKATPPASFNATDPASGSLPLNLSSGQAADSLSLGFRPAALSWRNSANALDSNNDFSVDPIDALLVINDLIANGARVLPATFGVLPPPFVDINGDGWSAPNDALDVINFLIAQVQSIQQGEGEAASGAGVALAMMEAPAGEGESPAPAPSADSSADLLMQQPSARQSETSHETRRSREAVFGAFAGGSSNIAGDDSLLSPIDGELLAELAKQRRGERR